jgi:hypothetical protein
MAEKTFNVEPRYPLGSCNNPNYFEAINQFGHHYYCHPNLWTGKNIWGESRVFWAFDILYDGFILYSQINWAKIRFYIQTYTGGNIQKIYLKTKLSPPSYSFGETGYTYVCNVLGTGWQEYYLSNAALNEIRKYVNHINYKSALIFKSQGDTTPGAYWFHENNPPQLIINYDDYEGSKTVTLNSFPINRINSGGSGICYNQDVVCKHGGVFKIRSHTGIKYEGQQLLFDDYDITEDVNNPCTWQSEYPDDIRKSCECTINDIINNHIRSTYDGNYYRLILDGSKAVLGV